MNISGLFLIWVALAQEYGFREFTLEDGLSHHTVHSSYQDESGFLWLGTYETIDLFDGISFRDPLVGMGVKVNRVRRIRGGLNDAIWIATHTGAVRVLGGEISVIGLNQGLVDESTTDILEEAHGQLWIATLGGLHQQQKDGSFTVFGPDQGLPDPRVRRLLRGPEGNLWIGTMSGLAQLDDTGLQTIPLPVEGTIGVYELALDGQSRLWVGTDRGLFCLADGHWFAFDSLRGLPSPEVWALCSDRFGNLWVGTDSGVVRADLQREPLETLMFQTVGDHEVGRTTIYSIDEDREGNLWFGTCVGLYQLWEPAFQNWDLAALGAGGMVLSAAEDFSGRTWFGTDHGVVQEFNGVAKLVTDELELPDPFVRALLSTSDGGLWFGTRRGALLVKAERRQLLDRRSGMLDDHIFSMAEGTDGTIYFGTLRGGMMAYREERQTWFTVEQGLSANRVYDFAVDHQDGLWIGTDNGLDVLDYQGLAPFPYEIPGKEVTDLHLDRSGNLWIGTNNGPAVFIDGTVRLLQPNGIPLEDACRFIAEDDSGAIWIGMARGIWRYENGFYRRFDGGSSTPREMNFGAWANNQTGHLWMGHYSGVLLLEPGHLLKQAVPPPIQITALSVFDRAIPMEREIQLPYNQNQPRFRFSGLSFRAPRQLTYQYRLDQYDRDWQTTGKGEVTYEELPPGPYQFQVRALDRDGVLSPKPASFQFQILPPFWQSWWFRGLLILVVACILLFQFQHLRLRNRMLTRETALLGAQMEKEKAAKLRREAELRLLHSQMNPHFLQNAFASTLYFVKSSPSKAELMLRKLSTLFRSSMNAKRQVWADLENEQQICRDYLEIQQLRFGKRLSYQIEALPNPNKWRVPGFVLQPLVENAVIHGLKETLDRLEIEIAVLETKQGLRVTVANSGQPLEAPMSELIREGHALDNINQRLKLLEMQPLAYQYENGRHQFSFEVEDHRAHDFSGG